jgi:O-antigen/teichoic acid export membrane protein
MNTTLTRRFGAVRRIGWGVVDQGFSSLTNFALGIVLARSLGAESFGAFTLAYVTYGLVLNASRGLATDPLLVRFSGADLPSWRRAVTDASGTAVVVGVVGGLGCLLTGLLVPGELGGAFMALGVGLPFLMLQDSWRFAFFAVGRPVLAVVNDIVWGALLVGTLLVLTRDGSADEISCMLAFGATGAAAAAVGIVQTRIFPRPGRTRSWLVEQRDLSTRYLVENLSVGSARQFRMFLLGALAGLAAVADVRAAEILMGPFLVLFMGVSQIAVPEASRVLAREPRSLLRFCLVLGGAAAAAATAWGLCIAALLSHGLGAALLGPIWVDAAPLVLPVTLGLTMAGFEIGAAAGIRALAAAPRSLRAQLVTSGLYVTLGGLGAWWAGAPGSCWGVALGIAIGAVVWWAQLRRAIADHFVELTRPHPNPDGERITT